MASVLLSGPVGGGVGGDGGATGGGLDHTAHSEPSSAVPISTPTLGGAFRGRVAGAIGAGGACACTGTVHHTVHHTVHQVPVHSWFGNWTIEKREKDSVIE